MSDLVNVDDVCEILNDIIRKTDLVKEMLLLGTVRQKIRMLPTVDAVEVVRCEKCKQWSRNIGIADSPNGHCFCHDIETNGYDFCSYGERGSDEGYIIQR